MTIELAYKILNINEKSTLEEIKASYKKLVKRYHPDIYNGVDADIICAQINNAYELAKKYINVKPISFEQSPYLKYKVPPEAILKLKKTHFQIIDEYLEYQKFYNNFLNIEQTISFEEWLKDELEIADICINLDRTKEQMIYLYNERKTEKNLNFINWIKLLYSKIMNEYEIFFNKPIQELEEEYKSDFLNSRTPFIEWLEFKKYNLQMKYTKKM